MPKRNFRVFRLLLLRLVGGLIRATFLCFSDSRQLQRFLCFSDSSVSSVIHLPLDPRQLQRFLFPLLRTARRRQLSFFGPPFASVAFIGGSSDNSLKPMGAPDWRSPAAFLRAYSASVKASRHELQPRLSPSVFIFIRATANNTRLCSYCYCPR